MGDCRNLERGQKGNSVVSVFGSATSEGEAADVVSGIGNTRGTGPVSDSAVAVLGNNYVDSKVGGGVVAGMGRVEVGPDAEIGGELGAVMGGVEREPGAIRRGPGEETH